MQIRLALVSIAVLSACKGGSTKEKDPEVAAPTAIAEDAIAMDEDVRNAMQAIATECEWRESVVVFSCPDRQEHRLYRGYFGVGAETKDKKKVLGTVATFLNSDSALERHVAASVLGREYTSNWAESSTSTLDPLVPKLLRSSWPKLDKTQRVRALRGIVSTSLVANQDQEILKFIDNLETPRETLRAWGATFGARRFQHLDKVLALAAEVPNGVGDAAAALSTVGPWKAGESERVCPWAKEHYDQEKAKGGTAYLRLTSVMAYCGEEGNGALVDDLKSAVAQKKLSTDQAEVYADLCNVPMARVVMKYATTTEQCTEIIAELISLAKSTDAEKEVRVRAITTLVGMTRKTGGIPEALSELSKSKVAAVRDAAIVGRKVAEGEEGDASEGREKNVAPPDAAMPAE